MCASFRARPSFCNYYCLGVSNLDVCLLDFTVHDKLILIRCRVIGICVKLILVVIMIKLLKYLFQNHLLYAEHCGCNFVCHLAVPHVKIEF